LQAHQVDFDTGSPTFWTLTDEACQIAGASCPASIPRYDATKSADYKLIQDGKQVTLEFGTGEITGLPSSDRFCFDAAGTDCIKGSL